MHIVSHLRTVGFKGFDICEKIAQKVIYWGKNTSGKSARSQAIALTLYGNIPFSTAGKRPSDILDSFGENEIVTAVMIDGMEFARKIYRNDKGVVSQSFQVNKKRVSAQNFAGLLGEKGNPKIANVSDFMNQSEAKKIDTLFDLYPVPELENIDQEIERAKAEISHINKKIEGAESTIQRLTASKNSLELPPGSISECQASIAEIEKQIADIQEQIKSAEIEEAKQEAAEQALWDEKERMESEGKDGEIIITYSGPVDVIEEDFLPRTDDDWKAAGIDSIPDSPEMAEADRLITGMENQMRGVFVDPNQTINGHLVYDAVKSIQRIIDALTGSGCSTCAALIVAKQELKKHGGN